MRAGAERMNASDCISGGGAKSMSLFLFDDDARFLETSAKNIFLNLFITQRVTARRKICAQYTHLVAIFALVSNVFNR